LIDTPTPTYSWSAVPTATWYYLWITDRTGVRIQQWYTAGQANCASGVGVCSVTPATAVTPGSAWWWVQTWNSGGYGPWSDPLSFTPVVPSAVTLLTPAGNVPTLRPNYIWNATPHATHYQLWVRHPTQPAAQIGRWFTAGEAGCASGTGTCGVHPAASLLPAPTIWWVQTWNPVGYGPWSSSSAVVPTPPLPATPVAPQGAVATQTPTFTWNASFGATWYYVWINDDNTGAPVVQRWLTAVTAGCSTGTGTCSASSATLNINLPSGPYRWWVQTYNDVGYGVWSSPFVFIIQ
jgi:hypothetical protein